MPRYSRLNLNRGSATRVCLVASTLSRLLTKPRAHWPPKASRSRRIELQFRAFTRSASCFSFVALAMGAVIPGCAISQASATLAGVELYSRATSSSAAITANPRAFRYFPTMPARGFALASASLRYLPVEKSACQREIRDHAEPILRNHRREIQFVVFALHQIVVRLQRLILARSFRLLISSASLQPRAVVVRRADEADFALFHQTVESGERVLERRLLVILMRLVEIDAVGLQPFERSLDRLLRCISAPAPVCRRPCPCRLWSRG